QGLAADLETCLEGWKAHGKVAPFALGRRDMGDILRIPQKLYGREAQVKVLLGAFDRVCGGRSELLLVSGGAGVGKSVLVHEVHKAIAHRGGDFIAGKFDQLHRGLPFSSFTQAFRELVRQILAAPPAALSQWKTRLLTALGSNAQLLTDLIPELELIIG